MSSLLFGHNLIYPSSLLVNRTSNDSTDTCHLKRQEQLYLHFQLSIATTSFILSTFVRTMIISPLMLIERQYQGIMLSSIIRRMNNMLDDIELLYVHEVWEDVANQTGVLTSTTSTKKQVPEIDLNISVPCKHAQSYLLQDYNNNIDYDKERLDVLRSVLESSADISGNKNALWNIDFNGGTTFEDFDFVGNSGLRNVVIINEYFIDISMDYS